jgi:signal transduction histidine kinase
VGLLGRCYQKEKCLILKDREDGSKEAKAFIRVAKETRSELCIPIKLFGRVLWILNLEDRLSDTFTPIEIEKLQGVIQQMQGTLERIFQGLILLKVLDVCPASIVITDQQHRILRCNRQARQIMQKALVFPEENLEDFLDLPPATISADPVATTFVGSRGKKTEVMASRFTLEEEYDQIVFMLQNIADLEWTAKFEMLRAALAEATAQVRVPVSLVSSFVKWIGEETRDERLQELARKAARQLGRIELTYDRVLASYETQTLPAKQDVAVNIRQTLHHILDEVPQRERDTIVEKDDATIVSVSADPFRVFFALNSMLAYLLRARSANEAIEISTLKRGGSVAVSMTTQVPGVLETHDLAAMIEATRTEIALGKDLLNRIAGEMGGEFTFRRQRNGRERLTLRLGKRKGAS